MINTKFLNEQELKEELMEELEATKGKVNDQKVMKMQIKREVGHRYSILKLEKVKTSSFFKYLHFYKILNVFL